MKAAKGRTGRAGSAGLTLALLCAACGHDWSAADAWDAPVEDAAGDDATPPDGPDAAEDGPSPDADDAGTDDAAPGDAPPDPTVCRGDESYCFGDQVLAICDPETGEWSFVPCAVACLDDDPGGAHCAEIAPSNLPPGETWARGSFDLECAGEILIFETEEGGIYRFTGPGGEEVLREPGQSDSGPIPFRIYTPQAADAAPLAVWSFRSVRVADECVVLFLGERAAAWFVESDVTVEGRITASPGAVTELLGVEEPGMAGPGGGPGGMPGHPGGGPGGGRPGRVGLASEDGGGGGGGFGGRGGDGGSVHAAAGGIGGAPYGNAELVPLLGGSGGGGGAGSAGGTGGGGGGAIQITAQGTIRIGFSGRIDAGGGGGQGGQPALGNVGGGGGGGSGGAVLLEATSVELGGLVAANGGGGGAGVGPEEVGIVGESGQPGQPATSAALGGLASEEATSGGDGSDAASADGRSGDNAIYDYQRGGGGGGGAAGRIRINVVEVIPVGSENLSPGPSTGLATFGTPTLL